MSEVLSAYETLLVARALRVMEKSLVNREVSLSSPGEVRRYLDVNVESYRRRAAQPGHAPPGRKAK